MPTDAQTAVVERRFEWWPAPAAPETPAEYNQVGVRRFRLGGTSEPAAVLILSPGFTGGINLLDYVAEEVTAAGEGRLEVWTTERRNNRLEDTRGMERAQAAADPRLALEYYRAALLPAAGPGDPGACRPLAQADAPFLRHWGLAMALADLREVVRRARAIVASGRGDGPGKVFLGGHSLGGMLAQCYAAWEFPERPGHAEIDGLVLIDGAVGGPDWTRGEGMAQYEDDLAAICGGEYYWDLPTKGAAPRFGILGQVAALMVTLPEWRRQPSSLAPLVPDLLRLPPGLTVTNEAALGLVIDAETSPVPSYRAHVGRLADLPSTGAAAAPVGWLDFRQAGELSDLHRIARALLQQEGVNGIEWYASRLLNAEVDLSSNLDSRDPMFATLAGRHGLRLWHHGEEPCPVFGLVTGSAEQKRERYDWYASTIATQDVTILEAPEQEHMDPLFAENDGRNRFLPSLIEWLLSRTPLVET
jgi:pimeloyl-ACP methyl ester carboxylesterase